MEDLYSRCELLVLSILSALAIEIMFSFHAKPFPVLGEKQSVF